MRVARLWLVVRWVLFALTVGTVTRAGSLHVLRLQFSQGQHPADWWTSSLWLQGFAYFTVPLLGIVLAHELGHLWACRRTGMKASGPYFFPWPTMLALRFGVGLLVGTFGAMVRMTGQAKDRAGAFDVGWSGPICGFAVAVWCVAIGLVLSHTGTRVRAFQPDPWLLRLLLHDRGPVILHPIALAGRYGLLLTGLNLIPIWPLDGWRIVKAAYGRDAAIDARPLVHRHWLVGTAAGVACLCLPSF